MKKKGAEYCKTGWLVSKHPRQQLGYITDRSQDWRLIVYVLPHTRQSGETMTAEFCKKSFKKLDFDLTNTVQFISKSLKHLSILKIF